jgi:hypothetical protein
MISDEDQVFATAANTWKVSIEDHLAERMDGCQAVGIDKHLLHVVIIRFERVDQFIC